jgi:O-antigen/teichoic acid export membrane protein
MSVQRHTLYNIAGHLIPLAASFLAIPPYIAILGEPRFGLLALIWLFTATMALFDLGMGQSLTQRLASDTARSADEQSALTTCALSVALVFGLIGAAVSAVVAYWYVGSALSMEAGMRAETLAAVPWAVGIVPIVTLSSVLLGALQARSKFGKINVIAIVVGTLAIVAPLATALHFGPVLWKLAASVLAVRLAGLILLVFFCRTEFSLAGSIKPRLRHVQQLLSFGGWAFVSACIGPLLVVSDRFLIGLLSGAQVVSRYTVPFQLAERVAMLGAALAPVLLPRFAAMREHRTQRDTVIEAMQAIVLLSAPMVIVAIAAAQPFLSWWISPDFAYGAAPVAQWLCVAFFFNGIALIPHSLLLARGRANWIAYCHLAELIPYAAILYFCVLYAGITGAAIAFVVRIVVDLLLLCVCARLGEQWYRTLLPPTLLLAIAMVSSNLKSLSASTTMMLTALILCAFAMWALPRIATTKRILNELNHTVAKT